MGVEVDGGEVVFKDDVVGGVREGEVAKVALVGFGPVGFSVVAVAESPEHGEEPGLGAAKVIDGIGAGATKVSNGFVNAVGNIDGDEVVGAKVFGELHGVALVGFDPVTGFGGDEGRRDHVALDPHFEKAPGDPETTSAGFVANVEVGQFSSLGFGNASHGAFEGVLGGADGAVVSRFGFSVGFENGDDSFCFMNIESEIECLRCA